MIRPLDVRHFAGAVLRTAMRTAKTNREKFYGNAFGLRIGMLHHSHPDTLRRFEKIMDWCHEHFDICGPEAVDGLVRESTAAWTRDRFVLTFDDGHGNTFAAAESMARRGMRGIFFVVPPYLGRTTAEFVEFHARNGVEAHPVGGGARIQPCSGLTRQQVKEMHQQGHRIAAHNFAHRDLGKLHEERDLDYEIRNALEAVSELTGEPCEDFAFGFGHVANISPEAVDYLQKHVKRNYAAIRGLNVPGVSPKFFVRDTFSMEAPMLHSQAGLSGAFDDRFAPMREQLRQMVGTLCSDGAKCHQLS